MLAKVRRKVKATVRMQVKHQKEERLKAQEKLEEARRRRQSKVKALQVDAGNAAVLTTRRAALKAKGKQVQPRA